MRVCRKLYLFLLTVCLPLLLTGSFIDSIKQHDTNTYISEQHRVKVTRGERPPVDYNALSPDAFIPGRIRIKFSEKISSVIEAPGFLSSKTGTGTTGIEGLDNLIDMYGLSGGRAVAGSILNSTDKSGSNPFSARHRAWGFHLWFEFETTAKTDIPSMIEDLVGSDLIDMAQPVFRVVHVAGEEAFSYDPDGSFTTEKADGLVNDPRFSSQWSFQNNGQTGGTSGSDIDLLRAWNIQRGNQDVVVAIIDGGVQLDHPDLEPHIWRDDEGHAGFNFISNTTSIIPGNHATHIAGIISAVSDNGLGVSGIAGGSGHDDGVKLMVLQVFSDQGCDGFHLAPIYAADHGAAITQNSWVYAVPGVYDQLALDAIDYFNTYGGGGILEGGLTFFAAGNKNADGLFYPACYSGTIAVASTNHHDQKAASSNYGTWVDISAPGVSILSTLSNGAYGMSSGTSMACPHVVGTAALMISQAPGLLHANELKDMLLESTDNHYAQNANYTGLLGSGRLNAYAAIMSLPNVSEEVPPIEISLPEYYMLSDGDWFNPLNWFKDKEGRLPAYKIPESNSIVHIYAGAHADSPVIVGEYGSIVIQAGGTLALSHLALNKRGVIGKSLIVNPGGRLTVTGQIIDDNETGSILIRGKDNIMGSLIHADESLQVTLEIDRSDLAAKWDLLAIPLTDQQIITGITNGQLYDWDESIQNWIVLADASAASSENPHIAFSQFLPGRGYLLNQDDDKMDDGILILSGSLTDSPVEFSLSRKACETTAFAGFNLLGNPYSSSIDWKSTTGWSGRDQLDKSGDSGHSIWVWNNETGNYGAYNSASIQDMGTNQVSRYLSPMQAFWVEAAYNAARVSINSLARTHSNQSMLKNMPSENGTQFKLSVSNHMNQYSDEVVIEYGHNQQGGSRKMFSMIEEAPSLYLNNQAEAKSILFLESPAVQSQLAIGFEAGVTGLYTITISDISGLSEDVFLIDHLTGYRHNFNNSPSYHFMGNSHDDEARFVLQIGEDISTSTSEPASEYVAARVYYHDNHIHVTNPSGATARIDVFNLNGASVSSFEVGPQSTGNTPFNGRSGIYLVRVNGQGQDYTSRIAIF